MQTELGTGARADRFYDDQVRDRLNSRMREFVAQQELFFLSTADRRGECDSTFRAGPPGFVRVLDDRRLAYPEYRGNGVMASLGNIRENPHVGILLIDFARDRIGLHVNGRALLVPDERMRAEHPDLPEDPVPGRRPQMWVEVEVEEAYIHCSKHIPRLVAAPLQKGSATGGGRPWGTDDVRRKGGDHFGAAAERRPERQGAMRGSVPAVRGSVPDAPVSVPDVPAAVPVRGGPASVPVPEPVHRTGAASGPSAQPGRSAQPAPSSAQAAQHALERPGARLGGWFRGWFPRQVS
ncbi:pyridoxamine 5'-phosphate oxidase family protein [Streptomyces sp. NPDC006733]|uniref:pyridoxamine 5'-phosphate oxidase family protein n=1 Tax=Streptomyces sp. NPDC006733 TaxID=3155460 RepID=UPI0033D46C35